MPPGVLILNLLLAFAFGWWVGFYHGREFRNRWRR